MPRAQNLTNQTFGKLTALSPLSTRTRNGSRIWRCACECGNFHEVSQQALVSGHTKSCGCSKRTRVTGSHAKVWAVLEGTSPKSIPDICKLTKLSWLTVRDVIRKMHHEGKVYIVEWSTATTPMWVPWDGTEGPVDAPKPIPMPGRERVHKHRQRAKLARDAAAAVQVQVEIQTPTAEVAQSDPEPEAPAWWEHLKD